MLCIQISLTTVLLSAHVKGSANGKDKRLKFNATTITTAVATAFFMQL